MSRRVWVPQDQILATDRLLTDPLPDDPMEPVEVERVDDLPAPPTTVDPVQFEAVQDLALALADAQPASGKGAAPVKDAADKVRGKP